MPPKIRVGSTVQITGIASTTVTATVTGVDSDGFTVELSSPGSVMCVTWHVSVNQAN